VNLLYHTEIHNFGMAIVLTTGRRNGTVISGWVSGSRYSEIDAVKTLEIRHLRQLSDLWILRSRHPEGD